MANSTANRKAMSAWSRQPKIDAKATERDELQKQLDEVLASPPTEAAMNQANGLYKQIALLNKKIATMKGRTGKGKAE